MSPDRVESLTYTSFKFPKLNRLVVERRLYLYIFGLYIYRVELHKSNSYHERGRYISQTTGCQTLSGRRIQNSESSVRISQSGLEPTTD
ncbi:MAG: hypothetical protein HC862_11235 [Scytonema sp. RU_4_4]|nr:hypothetical protein [Scytonema sp. RU_4_4]NJR72592.1 hypothetical protein [Scytonema sp. CRU_2_7]